MFLSRSWPDVINRPEVPGLLLKVIPVYRHCILRWDRRVLPVDVVVMDAEAWVNLVYLAGQASDDFADRMWNPTVDVADLESRYHPRPQSFGG